VILATVTSGTAMSAALGGLAVDGKLVIVRAPAEPLEVPAPPLIFGRRSAGHRVRRSIRRTPWPSAR
jgi:D-arabinose 1-dehydrogenase-like Zn-dependent alcohol dehydrogenase